MLFYLPTDLLLHISNPLLYIRATGHVLKSFHRWRQDFKEPATPALLARRIESVIPPRLETGAGAPSGVRRDAGKVYVDGNIVCACGVGHGCNVEVRRARTLIGFHEIEERGDADAVVGAFGGVLGADDGEDYLGG